jgi:hypothetical protein
MTAVILPSTLCPNCRGPMQDQDFERHDHGTVRVQLAPGAVIELFKEINCRPSGVRQPLADLLNCPRCSGALALSFDLSKSGRFSYFMCHRGDGRFTPFTQFLREKQFVRTLTAAELQRVRSQVRQITCSECGAPIDLEHDTQCKYCHSPVSFLDPDAVAKAVHMWSDADHHRHLGPTPEALSESLLRSQIHRAEDGPDLVTMGIHALRHLFMSRD